MKLIKTGRRILSGLLAAAMLSPMIAAQTQTASVKAVETKQTLSSLMAGANAGKSEGIESEYFGISDITIGERMAEVTYHAAMDCTIVVGFYDDEGTRMLASCRTDVSATEDGRDAAVGIPLPDDMPEYFLLKGFVLDRNQIPLSTNYSSRYYTEGVTEIKDADITDFDAAYTVNLDDSSDNNFFVLSENTIRIPYDGKNNLFESYDEETGVFVYSNVNSSMTSLKAGDIVFCDNTDPNKMAVFKVDEIEKNGKEVTITTADIGLEDAFAMIKLEGTGTVECDAVEGEDLGNGVTYNGVVDPIEDDNEDTPLAASQLSPVFRKSTASHTVPTPTLSFSIKGGNEYGGDQNKKEFSGNVEVEVEVPVEYEFLWTTEDFHLNVDIGFVVKFTGKIEIGKTCKIPFSGCHINFLKILGKKLAAMDLGPSFLLEGTVAVAVESTVRADFTITTDAPHFTRHTPTVNGEVKAEGEVFLGVIIEAEIDVGNDIFEAGSEIRIGFDVEGELTYGDGDTHKCVSCLSGEVSFLVTASCGISCNFLGLEFELRKTAPEFKPKLFDFYWSFTYHEAGLGECPYKNTSVSFNVTDQNGNPINANIAVGRNNSVNWVSGNGTSVSLPKGGGGGSSWGYKVSYPGDGYAPAVKTGTFANDGKSHTIDVVLNVEVFMDEYPRGGTAIHQEPFLLYNEAGELVGGNLGDTQIWYNHGGEKAVYEIYSDGHVKLLQYGNENYIDYVELPRTIDGYPVTQIEGELVCYPGLTISIPDTLIGALYNASEPENIILQSPTSFIPEKYFADGNVKTIELPDTLTGIGNKAFYRCDNLTDINIPDGVSTIGDEAFARCTSLTDVHLPASLTSVSDTLFGGCTSLKSISIPDGVTSIGDWAFSQCKDLTSVTLPDSLTYIGEYAFDGCTNLKSITIPDSVTYIAENAFNGCTNLTNVRFPNSELTIGDYAFYNTALTDVTLSDATKSIGKYAFAKCPELRTFTLTASENTSETAIGSSAFNKCEKMTSVTIAGTVSEIGAAAFYNCTSLKSVVMSGNVSRIEDSAFSGCTSLEKITLPETMTLIGSGAFSGCDNLKDLKLPAYIQTIGELGRMAALKSITFPQGLTEMRRWWTDDTPALTDVYFPGTEIDWNTRGYDSFFWYHDNPPTVHYLKSSQSARKKSSLYFSSAQPYTPEEWEEEDVPEPEPYQPDYTVEKTDTVPADEVYSMSGLTHIVYQNAAPDEKYLVLAIGADDMRYIDQQTSDETGTVEFILADLPEDTVYILIAERGSGHFLRYEGAPDIEEREPPEDENQPVVGDANLDGEFTLVDVVILQKWLLKAGKLPCPQNCDFYEDGIINVFDLVLMKRAILERL